MLSTEAESISCGDERARIDDVSDAELVQRFVYERDQAAFTCIVERYSRLVLGVALRHLRDRNRAEDAFQATFLVLAENARKIRKRKSLASWLHGVARRVALRTMSEVKRETTWEAAMEPAQDMLDGVVQAFEQQALDKELAQLPRKYRDPLTLHYLEGLSHAEIAKRLGLSIAAVDGRLKRGRSDLRLRLVRRGVSLSIAAGVFHISQQAVQAATFPTLVSSTSVAAQSWVAGTAVSSCTPNAVLLAGKEIAVMAAAKTTMVLSITGAVCLAAGMVIASGQGGGSGDGTGGASGMGPAVVGDGSGGGDLVVELIDGEAASGTADSEPSFDIIGESGGAADVADYGTATGTSDSGGFPGGGRGGGGGFAAGATGGGGAIEDLRVYQLQNVSAGEVVTTLQQLLPEVNIVAEERTNSVLVASDAETQLIIESLLQRLDEAASANTGLIGGRMASEEMMSSMMGMGGMGSMGGPMGIGSVDYGQVSEGRQRIEGALDQITRIEFQAMPISDGMSFISETHDIPIRIDEAALSQVGISPDEEITFTISGLSVQNALEIMLQDVAGEELAYLIKNDILWITTADDAEHFMETRVYEMRHYQGLTPSIAMQLIQQGTGGDWSDIDGIGGTIVPIQGGLMVRQNQRVHRDIQALLEQIQQFTAAGLETPSEWLNVDGSGYYGGMMGSGIYGGGAGGGPMGGGGVGYGVGNEGMSGASGGFSEGDDAGTAFDIYGEGATGRFSADPRSHPDAGAGPASDDPFGAGAGREDADASAGSPGSF